MRGQVSADAGRLAACWRLTALAAGIATLFVLVAVTGSLSPERVRSLIEPLGVAAVPAFVVAFSIARFVAHDAVDAIAGRRLRNLQAGIERRGFWAVLYARIAPGVP